MHGMNPPPSMLHVPRIKSDVAVRVHDVHVTWDGTHCVAAPPPFECKWVGLVKPLILHSGDHHRCVAIVSHGLGYSRGVGGAGGGDVYAGDAAEEAWGGEGDGRGGGWRGVGADPTKKGHGIYQTPLPSPPPYPTPPHAPSRPSSNQSVRVALWWSLVSPKGKAEGGGGGGWDEAGSGRGGGGDGNDGKCDDAGDLDCMYAHTRTHIHTQHTHTPQCR